MIERQASLDTIDTDLAGRVALIVDDNAAQREVLFRHLSEWGMTASTAADGDSDDCAAGERKDAGAGRAVCRYEGTVGRVLPDRGAGSGRGVVVGGEVSGGEPRIGGGAGDLVDVGSG